MATTNINISIDSELIDKVQSVSGALEIDMSAAINMLLRKAIYQQEISLDVFPEKSAVSKKKDRRAAFGCLKGKIRVPDDFNEPLDDFREYMQ